MRTSGRSKRIVAVVLGVMLLASAVTGCAAVRQSADESVGRGSAAIEPSVAPTQDLAGGYSGEMAPQVPPASEGTKAATDRMIIRSKTLRLEVDSTPKAVEALRDLTASHSGVITNMQVATDTDDWLYRYDESGYAASDGAALRGWVTVRVPAESLEAFTEGVLALGTVKYQAEDTEDVTQQHVDLAARLENLRAEEVRLRSFFDAATNVEEMLAVEAELNRIRGEIESMDAQVKYLERQAAMATVTIELTEERAVVRPEGDSWGFRDAITSGFRGAANVVTFAIALVIATAPLWILALILFFVIRAVIRRRRTKHALPATPEAPTADTEHNEPEA